MKKIAFFIASLFFCMSLSAKTVPLSATTDSDGSVVVTNEKSMVKDRIHIENHTDKLLEVVVTGRNKKTNAVVTISTTFVDAKDQKFVATEYEDKLRNFSEFTIRVNGDRITSFTADAAWNDLYFAIATIESGGVSASSISAADELAKWKRLLDNGTITQTEFDAKKKQLLGL